MLKNLKKTLKNEGPADFLQLDSSVWKLRLKNRMSLLEKARGLITTDLKIQLDLYLSLH